jgi:hypothetical protein
MQRTRRQASLIQTVQAAMSRVDESRLREAPTARGGAKIPIGHPIAGARDVNLPAPTAGSFPPKTNTTSASGNS